MFVSENIGAFTRSRTIHYHHVTGLKAEIEAHFGHVGYIHYAVHIEWVVVASANGEIIEPHYIVFYSYSVGAERVWSAGKCKVDGCGVEIKRAVEHRGFFCTRYFQAAVQYTCKSCRSFGKEGVYRCQRETYHGEVEVEGRCSCAVVQGPGQRHSLYSVDIYVGIGIYCAAGSCGYVEYGIYIGNLFFAVFEVAYSGRTFAYKDVVESVYTHIGIDVAFYGWCKWIE